MFIAFIGWIELVGLRGKPLQKLAATTWAKPLENVTVHDRAKTAHQRHSNFGSENHLMKRTQQRCSHNFLSPELMIINFENQLSHIVFYCVVHFLPSYAQPTPTSHWQLCPSYEHLVEVRVSTWSPRAPERSDFCGRKKRISLCPAFHAMLINLCLHIVRCYSLM